MVKHRPYPLIMNACGPFGAKQIRDSQFEEQITERSGVQDAGIVERGEGGHIQ